MAETKDNVAQDNTGENNPRTARQVNSTLQQKLKREDKDKNMSIFDSITKTTFKKKVEINKEIPTIYLNHYTKTFKKFVAADNVSLNVGHGVIHGFIGPNGSGKTTCIKAMIGAYVSGKGQVSINGHEAGTQKANSLIGYIPERASFPKHLNSISYLSTMGQLSGLEAGYAKKRAKEILISLGLEKHMRRKPISFSSGMQKKILLAQALITDPDILILDEPAANLDPSARKELFDELIKLRIMGKSILISSHILAELERIIDEVSFMYYSKLIFSGKVSEVESGESDAFIKTSNNELVKPLIEEKFHCIVVGDIKTEMIVKSLSPEKSKKLFKYISSLPDIQIKSLRANDLQSIYDRLIVKAEMERIKEEEEKRTFEAVTVELKKPKTVVVTEEQIKKFESTQPLQIKKEKPNATSVFLTQPKTEEKKVQTLEMPIKAKPKRKHKKTPKTKDSGKYLIQKSSKVKGWELKKTGSAKASYVAKTKADVEKHYKKDMKVKKGTTLITKGMHGKIKKHSVKKVGK